MDQMLRKGPARRKEQDGFSNTNLRRITRKFIENENKYLHNIEITGSKKIRKMKCVSAYESAYYHIKSGTETIIFGFGNS